VHVYPKGTSYAFDDDLASSQWAALNTRMPVLMGEFGARHKFYLTVTDAAYAMRDQQVASCSRRFRGWLFWTYDTVEQSYLWNLLDERGAINGLLAPIARCCRQRCTAVGLELRDFEIPQMLVVEPLCRDGGTLEPAIDRAARPTRHPINGRNAVSLDSHGRNLVELVV